MIRKIIHIDEEKCNGCGICADACHEGAIAMVEGKAKLTRDDYCDGLGDCLPACPAGAITFVEREAAAYDADAVKRSKAEKEQKKEKAVAPLPCGCPGTQSRKLSRAKKQEPEPSQGRKSAQEPAGSMKVRSQLGQWPVQIRLVPAEAPYLEESHLLVAADCTAYAYGNFHQEFIKGRVTLVGCPKLDHVDYKEKLEEIIRRNDVQSITVVRMEVPCCGGLERAVKEALEECGKVIPCSVVTITTEGERI